MLGPIWATPDREAQAGQPLEVPVRERGRGCAASGISGRVSQHPQGLANVVECVPTDLRSSMRTRPVHGAFRRAVVSGFPAFQRPLPGPVLSVERRIGLGAQWVDGDSRR